MLVVLKRQSHSWPVTRLATCLLLSIVTLVMLGGCWLPNEAPVAVISANPTSGEAPLEVTFDASESYDPDGDEISYEWDFGDGEGGEGQNVQHRFNSPGEYPVVAEIRDTKGATTVSTLHILVFLQITTDEIGSVGGKIETRGGAAVTFLPGAIGSDTSVTIAEAVPEEPVIEALAPVGNMVVVEISAATRMPSSLSADPTLSNQNVLPKGQPEESIVIEIVAEGDKTDLCVIQVTIDACDASTETLSQESSAKGFSSGVRRCFEGIAKAIGSGARKVKVEIGGALRKVREEVGSAAQSVKLRINATLMSLQDLFVRQSSFLELDWDTMSFGPFDSKPNEGQTALVLVHGWQFCSAKTEAGALSKELWANFVEFLGKPSFKNLKNFYKIYAFEYNSSLAITENGRLLKTTLGTLNGDAVILAHSMGGLVARSAIEEAGATNIHALITLGAPHNGTPLANKGTILLTLPAARSLLFFLSGSKGAQDCTWAVDEPGFGNPWLSSLNLSIRSKKPTETEYLLYGSKSLPTGSWLTSIWNEVADLLVGVHGIMEHDGVVPFPSAMKPAELLPIEQSTTREFNLIDHFSLKREPAVLRAVCDDLSSLRGNQRPTVSIISPNDGSTYIEGDSIAFQGEADDPEDGPLSGSSLFWTSSIYGEIGIGQSFDRNDLAVGTHIITLKAVDSQGEKAEDSVTITIAKKPDLKVRTVRLSKSSAQVGDTISVTFTVENKGGLVSAEFQNRVFLSTTQYGGGGQKIPLGDFPLSLGDTDSKTDTAEVTIPQVPGGTWYLAVYADCNDVIHEGTNENNNIDSAPLSISKTPKTLDRVTISGPSQVDENSTGDYACTAYFSDGTNSDVTYSASWSENTSYTTISSSGHLSVGSLTSDKTCTVSASYKSSGITKTATKSVTLRDVPQARALERLGISGPDELDENTSGDYTCTAYFSDGTNSDVTYSASWSENTSYTTISSSGHLSVGSLTSDKTCTVSASYKSSGITKTATKSVTLRNLAPPEILARIDSYSPSNEGNPATIEVGDSVTIRVTFTNTGDSPWRFIAGASIWNSNGQIVVDYDTTLSSPLQPGQQTTVSWSHTVSQLGDYWLQFGVWKQTPYVSGNLLDKEPSPSRRLIVGVANQPPVARFTMSAQGKAAYENQTLDLTMESGQQLTVQFSAGRSSDDTGIASYQWKVDGTTTSRNRTFSWDFDRFKTYQILLTVTDTDGLSNSVGGQVRITEMAPPEILARIDSYSPSNEGNPATIEVGDSVTIRVTFTNTGDSPWRFIAGASIWNSNGQIVVDYDTTLSSPLQPGQQTTVSWSHTVSQLGDYWLQFGVWKQTPYVSGNLLDKEPSPSRRLIVGVGPTKFRIGDRVRVTVNLNVRTCADTSCSEISDPQYPGYAPAGAIGTVLDGPVSADGYVWWRVQFDQGFTGWSVENGLAKV